MGFSRQECWSGLPFPSPGNLPYPRIEPGSPALQADSLLSEPPGKSHMASLILLRKVPRLASPLPVPLSNHGQLEVLVLVTQSCLRLCDHVDCSPPGSSVRGILQARTLESVAIPFPRVSPRPRDRTWVSCAAGRFFAVRATREVPYGQLGSERK